MISTPALKVRAVLLPFRTHVSRLFEPVSPISTVQKIVQPHCSDTHMPHIDIAYEKIPSKFFNEHN
jgi:hypothetical protein